MGNIVFLLRSVWKRSPSEEMFSCHSGGRFSFVMVRKWKRILLFLVLGGMGVLSVPAYAVQEWVSADWLFPEAEEPVPPRDLSSKERAMAYYSAAQLSRVPQQKAKLLLEALEADPESSVVQYACTTFFSASPRLFQMAFPQIWKLAAGVKNCFFLNLWLLRSAQITDHPNGKFQVSRCDLLARIEAAISTAVASPELRNSQDFLQDYYFLFTLYTAFSDLEGREMTDRMLAFSREKIAEESKPLLLMQGIVESLWNYEMLQSLPEPGWFDFDLRRERLRRRKMLEDNAEMVRQKLSGDTLVIVPVQIGLLIDTDPESARKLLEQYRSENAMSGEVRNTLASLLMEKNWLKSAYQVLVEIPDVFRNDSMRLLLAQAAVAVGEWRKAEFPLLVVLNKNKKNDPVRLLLVQAYLGAGEVNKALSHIDKFISRPYRLQAEIQIESARGDQKAVFAALDQLWLFTPPLRNKAGELDSEYLSTLLLDATNAVRFQNEERLRDLYTRVEAAGGLSDPLIANGIGFSLVELGMDLPQARDLIFMALEDLPDNAAVLDSAAWVEFLLGNNSEARGYIDQALAGCGDYVEPEIFRHAAEIYWELGEKDKAIQMMQDALQHVKPGMDAGKLKKWLEDRGAAVSSEVK